jgi:polysaccharide biosynthesis PFTS motif protein
MGVIAAVKQELTTHSLNLHERHFSSTVMGAGKMSGELVVRQYLLVRVGGTNLNQALLMSAGKPNVKVVYAMPSEWFGVVERYGFQVDRLRSSVLWGLYVCALFSYGVIKAVKVAGTISSAKGNRHQFIRPHAYFADLVPNNLPKTDEEELGRNITSWYVQWEGKSLGIGAIHHSVSESSAKSIGSFEVNYQPSPLPGLTSIAELARYSFLAGKALLISAVDLIRGRWWHALLLNQAALAVQARVVSSGLLAKEYLFHNSSWIYRPLWTYEAEQVGAVILLYFYSTNVQSFNDVDKSLPPPYGWKASNWPCYLVWDRYQKNFILDATGDRHKVSIVGGIWFSDEGTEKIDITKRETIAVFDVQPFRVSKYRSLGLDYEYYVPQTSIQFLEDIQAVLDEFGIDMAFKRKRDIGKLAHPVYRSAVELIEAKSNVTSISSSVSATRLIENSLAVISMPYTSTALLGVYRGKPSIYYDSGGKVVRDDCAAHGIPVLIGREELRHWLSNTVLQN